MTYSCFSLKSSVIRRGRSVSPSLEADVHGHMSALTRPSEANRQKVAVEFKDAMLLGQEAERRRVAQELHDDISQRLMLVGLELNEVEQRVRTEGSLETEEKLRTVRRRVESIALDIYRISHNLHPTTLVHLGLVSAFRALRQDFSAQTHLGVEFTSDIASPLPSHDVEIGLYRVTQECLSNVARHSVSREAHVAHRTLRRALPHHRRSRRRVRYRRARVDERTRPCQHPGTRAQAGWRSSDHIGAGTRHDGDGASTARRRGEHPREREALITPNFQFPIPIPKNDSGCGASLGSCGWR